MHKYYTESIKKKKKKVLKFVTYRKTEIFFKLKKKLNQMNDSFVSVQLDALAVLY